MVYCVTTLHRPPSSLAPPVRTTKYRIYLTLCRHHKSLIKAAKQTTPESNSLKGKQRNGNGPGPTSLSQRKTISQRHLSLLCMSATLGTTRSILIETGKYGISYVCNLNGISEVEMRDKAWIGIGWTSQHVHNSITKQLELHPTYLPLAPLRKKKARIHCVEREITH